MKRLHVHVGVDDLDQSIAFYSTLFGAEPTVVKADYAKWMLDDPRVNFAILQRQARPQGHRASRHPGRRRGRAGRGLWPTQRADRPVLEEGATTCCYAKSEKSWIADPDGVVWEAFLTDGEATVYGDSPALEIDRPGGPARQMLRSGGMRPPLNVLFLCTGNSARSILAEALLNGGGADRFRAFSAGSLPKGEVHPMALEVLADQGFPTDGLRSKSWDEFAAPEAPPLDLIFTVCDNAAGEICPIWPGSPVTAHWGIEEPAAVEGEGQRRPF